jgi:hypothetical protein
MPSLRISGRGESRTEGGIMIGTVTGDIHPEGMSDISRVILLGDTHPFQPCGTTTREFAREETKDADCTTIAVLSGAPFHTSLGQRERIRAYIP